MGEVITFPLRRAQAPKRSEMYELGHDAAEQGDTREWCSQFGEECLRGYDAYWSEQLRAMEE